MDERECGTLEGMRPPLFVRTLTDDEREALEQGLRSRCLRPAALPDPAGQCPWRKRPPDRYQLGIDDQSVPSAARLQRRGSGQPEKKSSRAHRTRLAFNPVQASA